MLPRRRIVPSAAIAIVGRRLGTELP